MQDQVSLRAFLIKLVGKIRDARYRDEPDGEFLVEFQRRLPGSDIDNLCNSDYANGTIVDICLGEENARRALSRSQLLSLVEAIMKGPARTEAEDVLRVLAFKENCRHPAKTDLIFYPESVFDHPNPTVDEIVDAATCAGPPNLDNRPGG